MHLLLAPDSFKGSLSAREAAAAMAAGVRQACPQATVTLMPLADGGEGTLEALLGALGGVRRRWQPPAGAGAEYGEAAWQGQPAWLLESAALVGLGLPGMLALPVAERSSAALGQWLAAGLDAGCRCFVIGLGGTACNDGGAGLLAALGVRFLDAEGAALSPRPAALRRLQRADFSGLDARLAHARIVLLSDVDNPLAGADGATAIYGPQKGVAPDQLAWLDAVLARLGRLGDAWRGAAVSRAAGSGAAGGLGFALQLLGAERQPGASLLLDLYRFDEALAQADAVLTGEGRSDCQTLRGKAPWAVAERARRCGVPVVLISGSIDPAARTALAARFDSCLALAADGVSTGQAMRAAARLLTERSGQWLRQRLQ